MTPLRYSLLALLVLLLFALSMGTGSLAISPFHVASCVLGDCDSTLTESVLWDIRMPRALLACGAGAGLACAGAVLQQVTRNPLADPYLFGIVAGAGLGATIATLGLSADAGILLPGSAFIGALLAVSLVLLVASFLPRIEFLLLAGVAISFLLSACTQFLLYQTDPLASSKVLFWMLGSLAGAQWPQLQIMLPVVALALVGLLIASRWLDALMLGDEQAIALGVNANAMRIGVLVLCALMTAVIVAYCGGIGFVGLMVPHMVRLLWGNSSQHLLLTSAMVGAALLMLLDVAARQLLPEQEIPIGIVTGILGSGFFVFLMIRQK